MEVRVRPDARDAQTTWVAARLSDALSGSSWRQWVVEWDATPGAYSIEVRATDGRGDTQADVEAPPIRNGATGYHRVSVSVRAA